MALLLRNVELTDVEAASTDASWTLMIVPDEAEPKSVAGTVLLWSHEENGETISEIGWMVLPQFKGQGLGKASVLELLMHARADGRWGKVHAFPSVTNAASNGICRSLGFSLLGQEDIDFADRTLRSKHWAIDLANS